MLNETQQEQFKIQRQSETQRQERSELLLRVFKDVNRFLGTDVSVHDSYKGVELRVGCHDAGKLCSFQRHASQ